MNIQELQAKVDALKASNEVVIRERAEVARLEATLKLENNPVLMKARVHLALKEEQTRKLQNLVDECAGIITSVPIHNPKTRTDRKWSGNHRFNYGTQIDLIYQLATGILYSCQEHKQLLLAHVPISLEALEQFVDAFGTPAYYSRNHHVVVKAKPANLEALQEIVAVLQSELDTIIDTADLTPENLELEFVRGETTALQDYEAAVEAISQADFVL